MSPTGCDPDVYHHYGLPATDCANCSSPTPSAEPEGTTRSGVSMVFDLIERIVNSDRSDADVGLMLRRILNKPTIQKLRCPGKEGQTAPVKETV